MAAEKYRELKAGEVVLPTDELYVGAPVNKWLCGSLNCGKELPAQYVGGYRRLKNVEGVQTQSGEAPNQQLKPKMPSFADVEQAFAMQVYGNHVSSDESHAVEFVYEYIAWHFGH